jgi:hypothetical protein
MLAGLIEFDGWPLIVAALVGGGVANVLAWRMRSRPARFASYAIVAGGSSLALWSAYLLAVAALFPSDWSVELWGGAITLAVGSSLGLAPVDLAALLAGYLRVVATPGRERCDSALHWSSPE